MTISCTSKTQPESCTSWKYRPSSWN
jgi:hypothetical protein